ncbi:bifunctional serine/threonine-protein kinase/formylglycine-generating enzyme family protein [Pseudomarimonas salicorniae]|uniref:Bifunctional serine/threonine-protein kinase/formylglycine-generating enzyme family protein n=1 Tax=Pseudomarimonas salicorniae TaxID=2933270 RepID=A0ABT0GDY5_9GAMM|nr:bifunctional serine/threonine-protein kinase/formylglycine-generating enzyme family protein [Lysobacter sp. CAU 1642]
MIEVQGYTILGQIGKGGMATVYRARQVLLDREVALKVMSPQLATDPIYAQRFLQEARMLAALNHPNIVQVFDIGETPSGLNYFSMQLLTGGDFGSRLADGMSEAELVRVLASVAQALSFAHARGYVHRDVTPANILFDSHDQPVLTDFGIARALANTSRITSAGLSIGTSQYMSPEQARGVEVDHRSDIYSLGVLTYEAVVGHPPFEGDDGFAVAFSHVHDPVPRLPPEAARWQPLIDRAMAKDPDGRFPDCAAFIEALADTAPDEFKDAVGPVAPVVAPPPGKPRAPRDASARERDGAAGVKSGEPAAAPAPAASAPAASSSPAAAGPAARSSAGSGSPPRPQQDEALPARWIPIALAAGAVVCGVLLALGIWQWMGGEESSAPATASTRDASGKAPTSAAPAPVRPAPASQPGPGGIEEAEQVELIDPLAAAEQGEPIPEHTVQDPIAQLLAMAAANIRAQRYTTPPVTNALDRYKLALLIEPGNADAQQGIARVASIYLEIANGLDRDADLQAWLDHLAKAEQVAAESPAAREIAASVASMRKAYLDQLLDQARAAISNWDREAALAALDRAEKVSPGDGAIASSRRIAQRVGTVGYVFRDGQNLPEMVVVGQRLALSRSEITVAEYKRYWSASGKRRFGSSLPSCRNREGPTLFSRRNFENPDIPQDDSHPVVCLSYPMAEHFAAWVAERSGKPYRLPRADELAGFVDDAMDCRSNIRDQSFARSYSSRGGASCDDGHAATAPVRSFPAVAPGLFDVNGNVSEWTSDCADNRCSDRIVIGRSFELESGRASRRGFPADTASNTIGLRLALELPARGSTAP